MLELGSSGSVRGVSSNGHPYRDPRSTAVHPYRAEIGRSGWLAVIPPKQARTAMSRKRANPRALNASCGMVAEPSPRPTDHLGSHGPT